MPDITSIGCTGGDWTDAFRKAAEGVGKSGDNVIYVPAGVYMTGPIRLYSNTQLRLEAGARIEFLTDESHDIPIETEFEGRREMCHAPLIYAADAENVSITGGGILCGRGAPWWEKVRAGKITMPRPTFITFENCKNVSVEGVTLLDSPCWTIHPLNCDGVTIQGVTIRNPHDAPNTDGIDPDSCQNVTISRCEIDVGDDCVVIKSGTENTAHPRPSENISISDCRMLHGHGGVVIGSEMAGGVRGVRVSGCEFRGTDRGIRIKTRRGRGGVVENIVISDITMDDVMCPIVVNMRYFCGEDGHDRRVWDPAPRRVDAGTPVIRDVSISGVRAENATACAMFVCGLPESPVERLSVRGVSISMRPGKKGLPAMMDNLDECECARPCLINTKDLLTEDFSVTGATSEAKGAAVSIP